MTAKSVFTFGFSEFAFALHRHAGVSTRVCPWGQADLAGKCVRKG